MHAYVRAEITDLHPPPAKSLSGLRTFGGGSARVVVGLGEGAFGYSDCQLLGAEAVVVFERERGLWEVSCFPERCSAWAPARSSKFIAARAGAPGQRPSMIAMRGS